MSIQNQPPEKLNIFSEIRLHEFDHNGEAPVWAIADSSQQAAGVHASMFGIGAKELIVDGITWVLVRQFFLFDEPVTVGEEFHIKTWPSAFGRASSDRDFLFTDGQGKTFGRSVTLWVVMDIETRRMTRLPQSVKEAYPFRPDSEIAFPTKKVAKMTEEKHARQLTPRRGDVDMNGHINNARYMEWALEAVPDEIYTNWRLHTLDISFISECMRSDSIKSACGDFTEDDGKLTIHHSMTECSAGKECARITTTWIKR
ncbi:MAG: acyl-[acyl-carrier-protein] thioesterase [Desulfovibrio sp.]